LSLPPNAAWEGVAAWPERASHGFLCGLSHRPTPVQFCHIRPRLVFSLVGRAEGWRPPPRLATRRARVRHAQIEAVSWTVSSKRALLAPAVRDGGKGGAEPTRWRCAVTSGWSQSSHAPLGAGGSSDRLHWRATKDRDPAPCVAARRARARDAVHVVKQPTCARENGCRQQALMRGRHY
jgi:hypothetical protein